MGMHYNGINFINIILQERVANIIDEAVHLQHAHVFSSRAINQRKHRTLFFLR